MNNPGNNSVSSNENALRIHLYCALLSASALTACGGGGGGGGSGSIGGSAPVAIAGNLSIDEDTPGASTLVATDADGDTLTYRIVSNASAGTVNITDASTGAYTYTPHANASGSDSFTFLANDGVADSNTATVAVTINPINDPPVADPGVLTTDEDVPVTGMLSASDPDGGAVSYSIVSNAGKGSVNITDPATGAYSYVPDTDVNGTDSFTFKASDGLTDSNIATVSVDINPVNDPPVATGSCSNTPQAQILTGFLNATDVESPNLLMYSLNADGSGGLGPITTTNNGTVTITDATTGEFSYQPASTGARGIDTFTYRVIDPDGEDSSATETVVVVQKIMPLGDSITAGVKGPTVLPSELRLGFRKPLYDSLTGSGFMFDFVGSLADGASALPDFDIDHEGHGGLSAAEIAFGITGFPTDGVRAWLDQNPADFVLLHAGTNDLNQTTEADIANILNEIDQWEQSAGGNPVTVILALIIDQDPINPAVTTLNDGIQSMAGARITAGDDLIVVNQHDALIYPNDLSDQLHPNDTGYAKMADVWFNALTPIMASCNP